jgi:phosphotransferase system HPr (HPr) family protein
MIETEMTVNLKLGLHARPSAYIVTKFKDLNLNKAYITFEGCSAQLNSILSLLGLFVHTGNIVKVVLSGSDEKKALEILDNVFNERDNEVIYS